MLNLMLEILFTYQFNGKKVDSIKLKNFPFAFKQVKYGTKRVEITGISGVNNETLKLHLNDMESNQ